MGIDTEAQAVWDAVAAERAGTTVETPPIAAPAAAEPTTLDNPEPTAEPSAAAIPEDPAAKTQEPDPTTVLITELKTKLEKLEGRQRTVDGHIGGIKESQTKILEMLSASDKASRKVDDAPTQAQVAQAIQDPQEWADLKAEYPAWATATEKMLDARLAAHKPSAPALDPAAIDAIVAEKVQGVTATMRQEIIDSTLEVVLPKWKQEINSEAFGTWMASQPDDVKALAESDSVGDAAKMLKLFDDARKAPDPAEAITNARKQTLAAAAATPRGVRVPATKTADQMTPEELWDHEARQRQKQKAQRGY